MLWKSKPVLPAIDSMGLLYQAAFEASSDGMAVASIKTKELLLANDRLLSMLGYTREELPGLCVKDLHPKEHLDKTMAIFDAQAHGQIYLGKALPVKRKDGTVFFADILSTLVTISGEHYLIGNFRDVTRALEKEEAERLDAVLKGYISKYANDFLILLDDKMCFLDVNERALETYGYTRQEFLGKHATDLRAAEVKNKFDIDVAKARAGGKAVYETLHQTKEGKVFPVEISLAAVDVEGKRIYQAVIRDISERKKVQLEMEKTNAQLREKLSDLERFDKVTMGREKRIVELKEEVARLKTELAKVRCDEK